MPSLLVRTKAGLGRAVKPIGEAVVGAMTVGLLRTTRYFDPDKTADVFGRITRLIGPLLREQRIGRDNLTAAFPEKSPREIEEILAGVWDNLGPLLREQRIGRANLTAAFPEKSPQEIEEILAGVWDNLGRMGAEFAHLDHIWDYEEEHREGKRIELSQRTYELFHQLRLDGKPALIFAGHLANWEIPALAAVAHGLDAAILYRKPNIASADRIIQEIRQVKMGTLIPAGRDAPLRLAEALKRGQHVAMLVDQYLGSGVEVTFFGRKTRANPTLARLLRQVDCPVHGVRIIRLPGYRFRAELSEEVKPVRDESGRIDVQGTMQAVTSVIEGWIREHPEQWLWLHRRWR